VKNVKKALLLSFILLLTGSVLLSAIVTYIFLNDGSFRLYVLVVALMLIIFVLFYLYKKTVNKLSDDIAEVINYLDDINNKDYDSIIKINTFQEFLQISLLLKNIVKRLKQREKKSSKK